MLAAGSWIAAEQAARDTKKLWGEAADRGRPRAELDKFREQYDQFRDAAQKLLDRFKYTAGLPATRQIAKDWDATGQRFVIANADAEWVAAMIAEERKREQKLTEHRLLEEATATMKAQIAARAMDIEAKERESRMRLEQATAQLGELEAKKAAIEAELKHIKKDRYEFTKDKVKQAAEEKRMKAEKYLKEKREQAKPDREESKKPDDSDGAQRGSRDASIDALVGYSNALVANAREVWKQKYQKYHTAARGGEAQQEAAAREHYFQLKGVAEGLRNAVDVPARY